VTPAIILLAVVVTVAAVIATSAREPRFAALGMIVALVGGAYVTEPLPGLVALATRLAGSALGGYLVWVALRGAPPPTAGWRVGWPGAAAVATVAFAIGWLAAGSIATSLAAATGSGPSVGAAAALAAGSPVPRAALGAALALIALAAAPVLIGRDILRLGLGLLLLLAAAGLLRNVMAVGTDGPVEFALAVLTALCGASVAAVVARSLLVHGDLELREPTRDIGGHLHGDDAHPRPWPGMYGPFAPRRRALPPTPAAHRDQRRPERPVPARPEPPSKPGGQGGYGTGWPGTH
jgi:hypothetical protein